MFCVKAEEERQKQAALVQETLFQMIQGGLACPQEPIPQVFLLLWRLPPSQQIGVPPGGFARILGNTCEF